MPAAPLPPNEQERLGALVDLCLLDTPPDVALDQITRLAATIFGAPIALISLLDARRQWFKARVGLLARETPREYAFCGYAILTPEPLVVLDARNDPRFVDNPLVTGPPRIAFYAGIPLRAKGREALGTLCVIGTEPRASFGPGDVRLLRMLGALVETRIESLRAENYVTQPTAPVRADAAQSVLNHAMHVSRWAAAEADRLDGPIATCRAGRPLSAYDAADLLTTVQQHLRKSSEHHVLAACLAPSRSDSFALILRALFLLWRRRRS